jgi:autotransporter-associated beta strand protein
MNVIKTARRSRFSFSATLLPAIVLLTALAAAPSAFGASATWTGTTNSTWSTVTNWTVGGPPGTGDTATFNNAGNGNTTLNLGAGVTVNTILFDTSSAAAYTIGSGAVGSQTLTLNDSGAITVNSTVTNNETVNANVILGLLRGVVSTISLTNNSTTPGQLLTFAGSISPTTLGIGGAASKTLALGGSGNGAVTGIISGIGAGNNPTLALTKSGTGTWTLSGTNTYVGTTTVTGGTLLINGNQSAATGAVTVSNSGTTLGGTGTIGGTVTINSGARILGGTGAAASGALTLANNLTLNSGSIIELALGAAGAHSTLARTGSGTWSFQSNQAFTFINLGATVGTYNNIITGLASNPGTGSWTITNSGFVGAFTFDGANIDLTLAAVPEPSTWIGGALALAALGYAKRRRLVRSRKQF